MLTKLRSESLKEREHFGELDVDGSKILKCILGDRVLGGGDLIELAKDRVQYRGFVSMVMNLRLPQNRGTSHSLGAVYLYTF
jgi:hypothetical protein